MSFLKFMQGVVQSDVVAASQDPSNSASSKENKGKKILKNLDLQLEDVVRQDARDWQNAYEYAIDPKNPDRRDLLSIYSSLETDGHISSLVWANYSAIAQMPFNIHGANGEIDEKKTELFNADWFSNFISIALDSIYWGYSGVSFGDVIGNKFEYVKSIPRKHILPESNGIVKSEGSHQQIDYSFDKAPLNNWGMLIFPLFPADRYQLGLYNKLSKLYIYKRNILQFWAIYNEIYGAPFMLIKTDSSVPHLVRSAMNVLKKLKNTGGAVMDTNHEVEFAKDSSSAGSSGGKDGTYHTLITWLNDEISKVLVGSTMTTDDGSSLSQAQVHAQSTSARQRQISSWMQRVVNDMLIPRMIKLGFPLNEGDHFIFDNSEKLTNLEWAQLFESVNKNYKIPADIVSQKIGVPVEERKEEPSTPRSKVGATNISAISDYYDNIS